MATATNNPFLLKERRLAKHGGVYTMIFEIRMQINWSGENQLVEINHRQAT
jgi:hypothetical protein